MDPDSRHGFAVILSVILIFLLDRLHYTSGLQCHWQGVCTESKLIGFINFSDFNVMDVSAGKSLCDVKCRDSLAFGLNCTHNVWDHRARRCLLYEGNPIHFQKLTNISYY